MSIALDQSVPHYSPLCGNITINKAATDLSAAEIKQLFDRLYTAIEASTKTSPADKEAIKAEVKENQSTVTEATKKNEKVDESFLYRRFHNIARMAPDVVVASWGIRWRGWESRLG